MSNFSVVVKISSDIWSKGEILPEPLGSYGGGALVFDCSALSRHQNHVQRASMSHGVPVYFPAYMLVPNYTAWWQRAAGGGALQMRK